jgi:glycosyltransferase involved in cell wall biosynthesis
VLGSGVRTELFDRLPKKAEVRAEFGLPDHKTRIIGYVGSLGPGRGIDLMLRAAKLMDSNGLDLFWLFVGGKPEMIDHWIRMAKQLGLSRERYRFAGYQPQRDLPYWYAATDILCAPYTSDIQTLSVMAPMKLVEYKAARRPIIASDFPAVRTALGDTFHCHYFEKDSVRDLCHTIENLLTQALPDRNTDSCDEHLMKESWTSKAEQLHQWLSQIDLPMG